MNMVVCVEQQRDLAVPSTRETGSIATRLSWVRRVNVGWWSAVLFHSRRSLIIMQNECSGSRAPCPPTDRPALQKLIGGGRAAGQEIVDLTTSWMG